VRFQPRRAEEPDVNMTSLIDVVLLLLIFFMLSTRFIDEGRLQLRLPEAGVEPEAVQRDAVEIEVTAQGGYRVNGRTLINNSPETLAAAIGKAAPADLDRIALHGLGFGTGLGQAQLQAPLVDEARREHEEDEQQQHDVDQRRHVDVRFLRAARLEIHAASSCAGSGRMPLVRSIACTSLMDSFSIWITSSSTRPRR